MNLELTVRRKISKTYRDASMFLRRVTSLELIQNVMRKVI